MRQRIGFGAQSQRSAVVLPPAGSFVIAQEVVFLRAVDLTDDGRPAARRVDAEMVITFPDGLIGCATWRRFVLEADDHASGLRVLRCLDQPDVRLFVMDPQHVDPGYQAVITLDDLSGIQLTRAEDAVVLCILTPRGNPPTITANLVGPLVVNPVARLGLQLGQIDSPYTTRHPLPSAERSASMDSEANACSF